MNLSLRTLLYFSANSSQAYTWDGNNLSNELCFENTQQGNEEFSAYLQQHPAPICLLVDVIEEDFRHESIPHLTGRDRRKLIDRKFEQYYRDTPFRSAVTQRQHTAGRKNDEILLSALTNPQHLYVLLDIVLRARIPLIGIYSIPHLSNRLMKDISSDHALLLSWEKHAGLRQSYFILKKLRLSRLIPINDKDSFAEAVATETPRMLHYLNSLNLPPQGETLDVYIICHPDDRAELESKLHKQHGMRCVYLDIRAFSDNTISDSDAEPLFLSLLARKTPKYHYAGLPFTRNYILWQLNWALLLLAASIALAGALWSGNSLWKAHKQALKIAPLLTESGQLERQIADIKSRFPLGTVSASDMKTAVTTVQQLDRKFPEPETILSELSRALDQFPLVHSVKIVWQAAPTRTIDFDGELIGFGNDYRSALAYLQNFQQSLTRQGYIVTAPKMPLDIDPQGSIRRDMQNESDQAAQFSLKLVRR